jgi:lipopolysaccharide/colanic/teichoic acid biosynthesis glycosyltransferase
MSIVGPRPPLPREVAQYTDYQKQRLLITPGITCYWQVQPKRNSLSFDEWLEWDLKYIAERGFWTDMKIFFKTIGAVIGMEGV